MVKATDLEAILRNEWVKPLERPEDTFGCSEIGFCMEKLVLRARYKRQNAMNGAMLMGKILHKNTIKELVMNSEYGKSGLKFWNKPKFESLTNYHDERGFNIQGHIDVDLPLFDKLYILAFLVFSS